MKLGLNPIFIFPLLVLGATPAFSFEATDWDEGDFSKARLISNYKAIPTDGEGLVLGLEIKMEEGWKTYWRSPGDAGQPPAIDWTGSVNLAAAEVNYPMPERFELFTLQTYGYPNNVIYPIKIVPAVDNAPITASARVNYLVCKDLCVPVEALLNLTLPPAVGEAPFSIYAGAIEKALAKVPQSENKNVEVTTISLLGPPGTQNVLVRLKGQNLMTGAEVILEDLDNFRFGIPKKRILSAANEMEFIIPVNAGGPDQNLAGKKVLMTLSDGWGNLEEQEYIFNQD